MKNMPPLSLLWTQQTTELCSCFAPSVGARQLLVSITEVAPFLEALIAQRLLRDAALLLAHGLQKRAAVWWACVICRNQLERLAKPSSPSPSSTQSCEWLAIEAAERWVRDPQERYRLAACEAAAAAGNRAPSHWAAMAAFWATGNMTPDAGVVTSPPPFLYAMAVVSALEFAAARCGRQRDEFVEDALRRGIDLASGGDGS